MQVEIAVVALVAEFAVLVVATSLGDFADDLIRIGHMGYNADIERVKQTMGALETVLIA